MFAFVLCSLATPEFGLGLRNRLPLPTMSDGLDAAEQRAVVLSLIRDDYSYQDFTRRSAVAPQRMRMRDVTSADDKTPIHSVDVWFVAYDDRLIGGLASAMKGMGTGKAITKEQLAKRGIEFDGSATESYRHVAFDFLEKCHLKATIRLACTRTEESTVIRAEVDPRFSGDSEFPNQWQLVVRDGNARKLGRATEWEGANGYMKITRLAEPAGALFVEQHIVFAEPKGWFDGANLLRSKVPIVVQSTVRATRREWANTGAK